MLCKSAQIAYKDEAINIIHIHDESTEKIKEANQSFKAVKLPMKTIMYARLIAYWQAAKAIDEPLVFVDTDMLIVQPLRTRARHGSPVLCRRSFDVNAIGPLKAKMAGGVIRFPFDPKKSLGELFPFLGCYLETGDHYFLESLCEYYANLEEIFKHWYGDQIAIREIAALNKFSPQEVEEKTHACLPEKIGRINADKIKILHFKGNRKPQMVYFLESFIKHGISHTINLLKLNQ